MAVNCQLTMAVRPILSPETVAQLSKPTSTEVFQVMENNIVQLLGNLPSEQFGVSVTTSQKILADFWSQL